MPQKSSRWSVADQAMYEKSSENAKAQTWKQESLNYEY